MRTRDTLGYSFSAIRLRKLRSGLTTLGIVIGITAIVALLSFTQGFQVSITNQFQEGFATNTLVVSAGGLFQTPGSTGSDFTLYVNDTQSISEIEGVNLAVAIVSGHGSIESNNTSLSLTMDGVNYTEYKSLYPTTFVADQGVISDTPANDSVVIGASINDPWNNGTLFAQVGDKLVISYTVHDGGSTHVNNLTVTVVGILGNIGGTSFGGGPRDSGVYMPLETAMNFFESDVASSIVVRLVSDDSTTINNVTLDIQALFNGKATVISATSVLATIDSVLGTVNLLLGGIAGISLLVAGVGIMNIMIVSLLERVREIGILKALGSKSRTILGIFLSEALIIGIMGGVIGILTGTAIAHFFSGMLGGFSSSFGGAGRTSNLSGMFGTITPVLTPELIFWAMFFSIAISVVFGLYPAWRASKLDPVEALRSE
jgi:putative ABC transport system permease protein